MASQLDEIEGKAPPKVEKADQPDREKQQAELAASEPSFDFKVENRTIALTWKNLPEVTINYYLMDPEFAFSSNPFVSGDASRFGIIKPHKTAMQPLPKDKDALDVPLPAEYRAANVLVEVLGAGKRKAQAYHANTLKLTLAENYGRLDVRDTPPATPSCKAYVKVYARLRGGTVRFFKDGYTDLRGRFDYASLNGAAPGAPRARCRNRCAPPPPRKTASTTRCSSPPNCPRSTSRDPGPQRNQRRRHPRSLPTQRITHPPHRPVPRIRGSAFRRGGRGHHASRPALPPPGDRDFVYVYEIVYHPAVRARGILPRRGAAPTRSPTPQPGTIISYTYTKS